MAKKFKTLKEKMSPAARVRAEAKAREMIQEMALDELREARHLTQEHLARVLHINQSAVSKLERRADMYVTTLQDFVYALGGKLEIRAVFPEGYVVIKQFRELDDDKVDERNRVSA